MVKHNLHELLQKNEACVDCDYSPVTHVSVQNGVTLCEECAKEHALFHSSNQITLKIEETNFTVDQLLRLECGGNERFNDFMSDHDLYPLLAEKYSSFPAQHYRKYILQKHTPRLRLKPKKPRKPRQNIEQEETKDEAVQQKQQSKSYIDLDADSDSSDSDSYYEHEYEVVGVTRQDPPEDAKKLGHHMMNLFKQADKNFKKSEVKKSLFSFGDKIKKAFNDI